MLHVCDMRLLAYRLHQANIFCGLQNNKLILFNLGRVFIHGLCVYVYLFYFHGLITFLFIDVLNLIRRVYLSWNTISAVVWFVLSIWRHDILTWITFCVPRRTTAAIPQQYKLIWHTICVLFYLRVFISLWKPNDELYLHLHMCSLVYFMNICSLLKHKYLFSNYSLSFLSYCDYVFLFLYGNPTMNCICNCICVL